MIGERILLIAEAQDSDWIFIKVPSGNYELRLGGIAEGKPELSNGCKTIDNPFIGRN